MDKKELEQKVYDDTTALTKHLIAQQDVEAIYLFNKFMETLGDYIGAVQGGNNT